MFPGDVSAVIQCIIVVYSLVTLCVFYAYHVNSRRPDDDPKKKNFHALAILLWPITLPLLAVVYASLFVLRVILYGLFAVLFLLALILVRKPFILEWLKKKATALGNMLLEANTFLIRLFLKPSARSSGSPQI